MCTKQSTVILLTFSHLKLQAESYGKKNQKLDTNILYNVRVKFPQTPIQLKNSLKWHNSEASSMWILTVLQHLMPEELSVVAGP